MDDIYSEFTLDSGEFWQAPSVQTDPVASIQIMRESLLWVGIRLGSGWDWIKTGGSTSGRWNGCNGHDAGLKTTQ